LKLNPTLSSAYAFLYEGMGTKKRKLIYLRTINPVPETAAKARTNEEYECPGCCFFKKFI